MGGSFQIFQTIHSIKDTHLSSLAAGCSERRVMRSKPDVLGRQQLGFVSAQSSASRPPTSANNFRCDYTTSACSLLRQQTSTYSRQFSGGVLGKMSQALLANSSQDADVDIRKAAQVALRSTGYRDLAKLGCHVNQGVVVLSGRVSSYYLKQLAQEAVLRLKVAFGVENSVAVQRAEDRHFTICGAGVPPAHGSRDGYTTSNSLGDPMD